MKIIFIIMLITNILYGKAITCGDTLVLDSEVKAKLHHAAQQRAQQEIEEFIGRKITTPYVNVFGEKATPEKMLGLIELFWCETTSTPLHSAYYRFYSRNKDVFEDKKPIVKVTKPTEPINFNNMTDKELDNFLLDNVNAIAYNHDKSASFIKNQKYVCINNGYFLENKFITNDNIEEAMKYPVRFYVDNNNIFHTDKGIRLNFMKLDKGVSAYSNGNTTFILLVQSEKEKMLITPVPNKDRLDMKAVYKCASTDNWTLAK